MQAHIRIQNDFVSPWMLGILRQLGLWFPVLLQLFLLSD